MVAMGAEMQMILLFDVTVLVVFATRKSQWTSSLVILEKDLE